MLPVNKNRYPNFMPVCMLKSLQSLLMLWDSMDYNLSMFLCPWDPLVKKTRMGCHVHLQEIFPTQGSHSHLLCLLHWQGRFFCLQAPLRQPPNFIETTQVLIAFSMKIYYLNIPYSSIKILKVLQICFFTDSFQPTLKEHKPNLPQNDGNLSGRQS